MPDYINPPIGPTDPDDIAQDALNYLAENLPGYIPRDGNPEVWVIMACARMCAVTGDVASAVPLSIFRTWGQTVVGLQPNNAIAATTATTWTMKDNAGYEIPAGTQCGFQVSGSDLIPFVTTQDVVIPAGTTTTDVGAVIVQAVDPGSAANGLDITKFVLVDDLSFVAAVACVSAPGGGTDAETDAAYIARLIAEVALFTPTPILGSDFGIMARNVDGVARAVGIDNYDPGYGAIPNVRVTGTAATGGSLLGGQTYQFGVSAVTVDGESLIGSVSYTVPAGTNTNTVSIAWDLPVDSNLDAITGWYLYRKDPADTQFLRNTGAAAALTPRTYTYTGTGSHSVAGPTTDTTAESGVERTVGVVGIDSNGLALSSTIKAAVQDYLESLREINFICKVFDPTYTTVNVAFTYTTYPGYSASDVGNAAADAVAAFLDPSTWGVEYGDESGTSWDNTTTVYYWELIALLNNVPGLARVTAMTINGGTADLVMTGEVPLPLPGTIVGTPA